MTQKFETFQVDSIHDLYDIICDVGKGAYGKVIKCKEKRTNRILALKKIKILKQNEGFPLTSVREIDILSVLHNDNIIGLRQIISTKDDRVYLAFDYCNYDLYGLIYSSQENILTDLHIASYIKQLLQAIKVCQDSHIVHRDLKPANIFITEENVLKLGDFGLAREISEEENRKYTSAVITLYYRAPELLFDCTNYKYEVDIWSAGCIIYEMMAKSELFKTTRKESTEAISQATAIFSICGTPNLDDWKDFQTLDKHCLFINSKSIPNRLREHFEKNIPEQFKDCIDLLMKMIQLNPSKRITAEQALMHPFITKYGDSLEPSKLPPINSKCELHQLHVSQEMKKKHDTGNLKPERIFPEAPRD